MANKVVEWIIRANYKQARKEAQELRDDLERVDRKRNQINRSQIKGDREADASLQKRAKAEKEATKLHQAMQHSTEKSTSATDLSTKSVERNTVAQKRETSVLGTLSGALKSHSAARLAAARATAQHNREMQANQKYGTQLRQQELQSAAAAQSLATAKQRLAKAEADHGKASNNYAAALNTVRQREIGVERAEHNLMVTRQRMSAITQRSDRDHRTFGSTVGRLTQWMFGLDRSSKSAWRSLGSLAKILPKLTLFVVGGGAAISLLVSAVSSLTAGVVALIGPTARLAGVLFALPGAAAAAAGGIGTIVAALFGMGDAIKAGIAAQEASGKTAKAVGKAHRDSGRQIAAANRAVADSEWNLRQAQQAARDAQKNLSDARRQARENIDAMRQSLKDLELQERGASLSVEEAQQRLREVMLDPNATSLQKREAQLALDEAMNSLDTVRKENAKAKKDMTEATKKGIEGSDAVVQAHRQEAEAQHALVQAQQQLIDSKQAVVEAHEAAAEAMASASGEATKYQEALKELSPEQRKFVQQIVALRSEGKKLRNAAAAGFLPGLGAALTRLVKLTPIFAKGMHDTGVALGEASRNGAKMLTSGPFTAMFSRILKSNVQLTKDAGVGTNNLIRALVNVADAARPFTEWLSSVAVGWSNYIAGAAEAGNQSGKLREWLMGPVKNALTTFGQTLANLWGVFKNLSKAGGALGTDLTNSLEKITERWKIWTGSLEGQNQLTRWFDGARQPLHEFARLIGSISKMMFALGQGPEVPEFAATPTPAGATPTRNKPRMAPGGVQLPTTRTVPPTGAGGAIKAMADDLVPALQRLLEVFKDKHIGEDIVKIISNIVDTITNLVSNGGGLSGVITILKNFSEVLKAISANTAAVVVLKGLAAAFAAIVALRFIAAITGLTTIWRFFKRLRDQRAVNLQVNLTGNALAASEAGMAGIPGRGRGGRVRQAGSRALNVATLGRYGTPSARTRARGAGMPVGRQPAGFMPMPSPTKPRQPFGLYGRRKAGGAGGAATMTRDYRSMGQSAANAAGAIGSLGLILSTVLPGALGEASEKIGIFGTVIWGLGPLLSPVMEKIGTFAGPVLSGLGKGMLSAVKYVGSAMGTMVKVVGTAMKRIALYMMANPWMLLVAALIIVVVLIVKHWDKVKAIVSAAINWIVDFVKKHWDIIKYFIGPIALIATVMVKHWDSIKKGIKGALQGILSMVQTVWGKLGDVMKAPLKFVIDLINNGLIDPFNKVAAALGFGGKDKKVIGRISTDWLTNAGKKVNATNATVAEYNAYARGGVLPGYTPGRDVALAAVSGGEAIMRPEWTRAIGKRRISEMNRLARTGGVSALRRQLIGGFATGGTVPIPAAGSWNRHTSGYPWATWAGDINIPGSSDYGDPVRAYKAGVIAATYYWNYSYGRHITMNHDDGSSTLYAHLSEIGVIPGQRVPRGAQIGRVGMTGNASGPHLHFEIRNGAYPTEAAGGGGHWWDGAVNFAKNAMSNVTGFISGLVGKMNLGQIASKFGDSPYVKMVTTVPRALLGMAKDFLLGKRDAPSGHSPDPGEGNAVTGRVPGFASGGRVRGQGTRDSVPAMLTPGEFVLNRKAVSRIGMDKLRALNNRRLLRKRDRAGNAMFADGGIVRAGTFNVWSGTSDKETKADLRRLLPRVDTLALQEWYGGKMDLVPWLNKQGFGFYKGPTGTAIAWRKSRFEASRLGAYDLNTKYQMPHGLSQRYATYGLLKDRKSGKKFWQTSVHFIPSAARAHISEARRARIFHEQVVRLDALARRLRKTAPVIIGGDFNSRDRTLLEGLVSGSRTIDQVYSTLGKGSISRVSGLASDHDATIATLSLGAASITDPTPVQDALIAALAANAKAKEFSGYLTTIASWGLTALLDKLLEMGVEDGYNIAKSAVTDKVTATALNAAYQQAALYTGDDLANFVKMIGFLTAKPTLGLRDLARALGLSDLATVRLFEKANTNGQIPKTLNLTKLRADIASYRAGTFYGAVGGVVPGTGSQDSVPAMLTPGEFVIQKRAAKALGLGNLLALNGFAEGGPVVTPKLAGMPGVLASALSGATLSASGAGIINYGDVYDVDIINPVAEPSTYSMMKLLQRRSTMKGVMTSLTATGGGTSG